MNSKSFIIGALFLLNQTLFAQSRIDSLANVKDAVYEINTFDQNGTLLQKGIGIAIDSLGNAVTMYSVIADASVIKLKTNDGNIHQITHLNGLDYERGLVRFSLPFKSQYFLPMSKKIMIKDESLFIMDLNDNKKLKHGVVKSNNKSQGTISDAKIQFTDLALHNTGNALIDENGTLLGIVLQDDKNPQTIIGISSQRIKNIQPYDKEQFNEDYFKGVIAMSQEKYETAWQHFDKSLQQNPYNIHALLRQGELNLMFEQYLDAVNNFNNALMIDVDNDYAFYNIGMAYYYMQQYNLASDWFSNAIKYNPENRLALKMRGEIRFLLGSNAAAIIDFDKAIALDANFGEAFYFRGICKASTSKSKKDACADLSKAKELGVADAIQGITQYCK